MKNPGRAPTLLATVATKKGYGMNDEAIRLQAEVAKAEQALADAERLRPRAGYGPELGTDADAQVNIDTLRKFLDVRKQIFADWQAKNPSAIGSDAFSGIPTQRDRARG